MPLRVTARLEGSAAKLGEVPAADIAHLILGVERAIARSAAQIVGRRPGTGRRGALIEASTRLRLVNILEGSVMPVLELPDLDVDVEGDFDLDVQDLGSLALDATLDLFELKDPSPDVAGAFVQLYDDLGIGSRYERLTLSSSDLKNHQRSLVLDSTSRQRVRGIAEGSGVTRQDDNVVGTLVEADFERKTARLRTSSRRIVVVAFSDELADSVQEILRRQTELKGRVHYDEATGEATRIEVERVVKTEQLLMGIEPEEFWANTSVPELISQHSGPVASTMSDLFDTDATDEELDAFLVAVAE